MEIKNRTGIADVVGGSSVFGTTVFASPAGDLFGGTPGSATPHVGLGHAASFGGDGYVDAVSNRPRPFGPVADTPSLRRFTGTTLPSRGSTRPEVVALH